MEDSETRRIYLERALDDGEKQEFVMSRRARKHEVFVYYLYTSDQETLLIAAKEYKTRGIKKSYTVTSNSRDISEESKYFLGKINDANGYGIFDVYHSMMPETVQLKIFLVSEDKMPKCFFYHFINGTSVRDNTPIVSINKTEFKDRIKILMTYNNRSILMIDQKEDDEYQIEVMGPLSIFQAFCICLATIISQ